MAIAGTSLGGSRTAPTGLGSSLGSRGLANLPVLEEIYEDGGQGFRLNYMRLAFEGAVLGV